MTNTFESVDLADPDNYVSDDGVPLFHAIRSRPGLYWNQRANGYGFWAITRYADAVEFHAAGDALTSEHGMTVGQDESAARAAAGRMLIVTDGDRHTKLRKVMNPMLAPKAIRAYEPQMREVVADAIDRVLAEDSFDFVAEIASRLPVTVICLLLGVPRTDWDLMVDLSRTAFGSTSADTVITPKARAAANADIFAYYADLVRQRRNAPGDDMVSELCRAVVDGVPLTDDEVLLNVNGLVTGGNETTRHASTGSVVCFERFPDQWQRLCAEPELVHSAVEEVLRCTAPSLNVMRTATRDLVIGGQPIAAGERVSVWAPAVNRDPEVFAEPDRFDITRHPNRHLTFGSGRHLCIGAGLSRFELRVLIEGMISRVGAMRVTGPVKRLRSNLMWGVDVLPTHLEPR